MGEISTADARLGVYTPLFRPAVRWVLGSFYWWKFSWPDSIRDCRFSGQPAKLKRFNSWNFVLVSMSIAVGFFSHTVVTVAEMNGCNNWWKMIRFRVVFQFDIWYIYIHTNWSLVHIALLVPTISPLFNHHLFETNGSNKIRAPPIPVSPMTGNLGVSPVVFGVSQVTKPSWEIKIICRRACQTLVKHCKGGEKPKSTPRLQGWFSDRKGAMMEKFGKKNLRVAWFLIYEWGLTTDFKLPRDFFWKLSPKRKNLRPHESHESTGCGL